MRAMQAGKAEVKGLAVRLPGLSRRNFPSQRFSLMIAPSLPAGISGAGFGRTPA
jgi:hypothetical protein